MRTAIARAENGQAARRPEIEKSQRAASKRPPEKGPRPRTMITHEVAMRKVLSVAAYVRTKLVRLGFRSDPDEIFQTAALAALEDWHRYGHKYDRDPFARMCFVAFSEVKLAMIRARHASSLSEGAATGRVPCAVKPGWESLYIEQGQNGRASSGSSSESREERFAA